jgi:hypothetical protein
VRTAKAAIFLCSALCPRLPALDLAQNEWIQTLIKMQAQREYEISQVQPVASQGMTLPASIWRNHRETVMRANFKVKEVLFRFLS